MIGGLFKRRKIDFSYSLFYQSKWIMVNREVDCISLT
jgi:hypothetical protein